MNQLDQFLTTIASDHLDIPTLETRRSDSLDFHNVGVWAVRSALKAAFDVGRQSAGAVEPELLNAAERVVSRWEEGDLAEAVRSLSDHVEMARAIPAHPPIVAVTVRGGLIEDLDATIAIHVIVEDWDVPDEDTGNKPTRSVWELAGDLTGPKEEKLRRLIAND